MMPIVTLALPSSRRHTALRIEVVPTAPSSGETCIQPFGELPDCACVVRTTGPRGVTGPVYYRESTLSGVQQALVLFEKLRVEREGRAGP